MVVTPVVYAQQSPPTGASTPGQSGTGFNGQPVCSPSSGTQVGSMAMQNTIAATVADVNQQEKTVRLRMPSGAIVELKVPEPLLVELYQSNSVQISICKTAG
jgi:hypothetical protein